MRPPAAGRGAGAAREGREPDGNGVGFLKLHMKIILCDSFLQGNLFG